MHNVSHIQVMLKKAYLHAIDDPKHTAIRDKLSTEEEEVQGLIDVRDELVELAIRAVHGRDEIEHGVDEVVDELGEVVPHSVTRQEFSVLLDLLDRLGRTIQGTDDVCHRGSGTADCGTLGVGDSD
jgi:transcription elongation factor